MKKLFIILGVMLLSITNLVQAQTKYEVFINGVQMTSDLTRMNSSNHPDITKGEISYNATTNTLTLDNVTMKMKMKEKVDAINMKKYADGTIIVKGKNILHNDGLSTQAMGSGISYYTYFGNKLKIVGGDGYGGDELLMRSNSNTLYAGSYVGGSDLEIDNCRIFIESFGTYGIVGNGKLTISNTAFIHVKPFLDGVEFSTATIGGFNGLSVDASILTPNVVWSNTSAIRSYGLYPSGTAGFYKGEAMIGPKITALTYDKNVAMIAGETKTLYLNLTPKYAWNSFTWGSSNTAVATVDATGKVTAKTVGTTTVTAIAKDGSGKVATFTVTVGYPVWVGGVQVTKANQSNIPVTGKTSGTISYADGTKTLTLNGVTLSNPGVTSTEGDNYNIIYAKGQNLNVNLTGANKISKAGVWNLNGIFVYSGLMSVSGTGSLDMDLAATSRAIGIDATTGINLTAGKITMKNVDWGLYSYSGGININGGEVEIPAKEYAIRLNKSQNISVYTNSSRYEGGAAPGTQILTPTFTTTINGDFKNTAKYIKVTPGASVPYDLWVGGTRVTSLNQNNITGTGITGKVSYDPATKTLTLNNAKITGSQIEDNREYGVSHRSIISEDDIKIVLIGTNTISKNAMDDVGAYSFDVYGISAKNISFLGNGKLSIDLAVGTDAQHTEFLYCAGVTTANTISILENASLEIETKTSVSSGLNPTQEKYALYAGKGITVSTGKLIFEGQTKVTAKQVSKLTLRDNKYSLPYVRISPSTSGLASLHSQGIQIRGGKGEIQIHVEANNYSPQQVNVYNLSGALVRTAALSPAQTSLKVDAGIYIVRIGNGAEKVVVQ